MWDGKLRCEQDEAETFTLEWRNSVQAAAIDDVVLFPDVMEGARPNGVHMGEKA